MVDTGLVKLRERSPCRPKKMKILRNGAYSIQTKVNLVDWSMEESHANYRLLLNLMESDSKRAIQVKIFRKWEIDFFMIYDKFLEYIRKGNKSFWITGNFHLDKFDWINDEEKRKTQIIFDQKPICRR